MELREPEEELDFFELLKKSLEELQQYVDGDESKVTIRTVTINKEKKG